MGSIETYARKLRLLTNTLMSIDELNRKRQLLLDEVHRVDAQLSKHRAFLLKLEIDLDETQPD
jgi:uncharacterized small protein (DUF1192 family)